MPNGHRMLLHSTDPNAVDPLRADGRCFVQNCALGTFGTANRRFFHGPGFNNTDFGISKRTRIKENLAFDIRVEFFNIFNHAQFKNPGGDISSSNFGIVRTLAIRASGRSARSSTGS